MLGVGIDWAEEFHLVAFGRPGSGVIGVVRVEHRLVAVAALVERITGLEPDPAEVRVVIETTHGLLVEALVAPPRSSMTSAESSESRQPLRGRFASLDTSAAAKEEQLRGGQREAANVPGPCQMQRETTVTHGRSQLIQMQANPGNARWLTDPKRPPKQRISPWHER